MRTDVHNLVKIKIWQYNHRARDYGGFVLMNNRYRIASIRDGDNPPRGNYHFLGVVFDYGDHHKIRFATKRGYRKGVYLKSFLYRK